MTCDGGKSCDGEILLSIERLNEWAVNREALRSLGKVGEKPDPESLYILQLALWAVRTGKAEAEPDVVETVNAMTEWRPERIMNFLMLREESAEYEPPAWREAGDPLELAGILLEDMEKKMIVHFPWYRSVQW